MIGKLVGHYRITAELGRGGMGEVYEAQDVRLGRLVALKFLPERSLVDHTAVERFFREARAASSLNHPNIVTIYDIGEADTGRFIAMELIQGITLRSVTGEALSTERLVEIGVQVAQALVAAHSAGIIHRDIKPENIMVRNDGYVKMLDFGLARLVPAGVGDGDTATAQATDAGALLGTVRYMSPEQGRGETVATMSDIFSLGIVLYELATGQHPFQANSQIGTLHAIMSLPATAPSRIRPGIPVALESLILRMLEKEPRLRPTAADVGAALSQVLGRNPVHVTEPVMLQTERHVVGRKTELTQLRSSFEAAAAGRGMMICIAGEPGIGKTTLVEDFFLELTGVPCSIGRGRCSERLAGSEAYLPFLEALESLMHGETGEPAAHVMKAVAPTWYVQIAPLSKEDSSLDRVMADAKAASQERMKRELFAFVQELSRVRPVVLFLDDLHWADVSTVDLLSYLGSKSGSTKLLLVGTYRPAELQAARHPFLEVKLELQGHGRCREILLDFLDSEEVASYLALEFPENRFPPELSALIHSKTEGNPLFMADLVRYLRDQGVIAEQQGRWSLVRPVTDNELPESVRSMIQRKINQLSDEDRRLLVAASVQGQEFDSAVVAKALGMDAGEVEQRLEALDQIHAFVRLVAERELPDSTLTLRYCFVHVLYQNALYGSLTGTRKASLSGSVAQALLGFYGNQRSDAASDLALLLEVARDFARASDYFIIAAKNSSSVCANQEAITLLRRAIVNADKLSGEARSSRVLVAAFELARLHTTLAQFSDAIDDFTLVEKVALESDDKEAQINAVCGTAMSLFNLKRMAEVRQHANRALEMATSAKFALGVASAESVLACDRLCAGDLDSAERYYARALPVLREQGVQLSVVDAFSYLGALHTWRLDYAEAERITGWALEKARALGASFHVVENLFIRGMALGNQGRLSEALRALEEARRLAELNGERYWLPRLPNTLGWIHREMQDLETALRLDTENVLLATEMGVIEGRANAHVNLGHDYLALGEPARAIEHLQQAEQLFNQDVWFRWRYAMRLQAEMTSYWIVRGDLKMAAMHAAAALQAAGMPRARKYLAWGHKLLGDIAVLEERMEDARREYQVALEVLADHPCPMIEWQILKAAAAAARRAKDEPVSAELAGRARAVTQLLADSIHDNTLRDRLLSSQSVREL